MKLNTQYVSRVGKVYVTTLSTADTWTEVLAAAEAKGVRGFKIKSRVVFNASGALTTGPLPFDYAFKAAPDAGASTGDGFWSTGGAGAGDEASPSNGIWARSPVAGTVIEVITYD